MPQEEIAAGPHRFCETMKFGSHRFHGVTDATLPHDEGWEFLRVGWALERAEMTARLVDVQYHNLLDGLAHLGAPDKHQWMAVLQIGGRLRGIPPPISLRRSSRRRVAEMLILHPQHPRSIRFNQPKYMLACAPSAAATPAHTRTKPTAWPARWSNGCATTGSSEIFKQGLHAYLNDVLQMCGAIGEAIARTYFYYAVVA